MRPRLIGSPHQRQVFVALQVRLIDHQIMPRESTALLRYAVGIDISLRGKQPGRPACDPPGDQVRVVRPGIAYGDVRFALGQAEHLRGGVQLHAHVRMLFMQAGDGRDQEVDGQRIGGADPHRAGQAIIQAWICRSSSSAECPFSPRT